MDGTSAISPPSFPDAGLFNDQAEASYTLPASWYTEPEMQTRERDAVFFRNWWYFCALSEFSAGGTCVAGCVLDQDILVTRLENGNLRGSRRAKSDTVRVEALGPMVFVNLSDDAPPLREAAGLFAEDLFLTCPGASDLVLAERFTREVAANWKTVIDNNHECYHCDANHVTLTQQIDFQGTYVWSEFDQGFCHKVRQGDGEGVAYHVDHSTERQDGLFAFLWPNLIPLLWPGSPNIFAFQVIPTGPETCIERWDVYLASADPSPEERSLIEFVKSTLIPEDVGLCESVQLGLRSRGYTQGRFVVDRSDTSFSEHHVHLFQKLVRAALIGS